ncbi:hypothetical protein Tco_1207091 [Tanacetum coccineum]
MSYLKRRSVKVKETQERRIIKAFQVNISRKKLKITYSHTSQAKGTSSSLKSMITTPYSQENEKEKEVCEHKNEDLHNPEGNVEPVDKGLPSTVSDEGTGKTKPLPERPHEDKDTKRLKLGITKPILLLLSHKMMLIEPDSQTLVLTTAAEVQALFLFDDDLDKSEDDEFEVGDEMDEDI